MSHAAPHGAHGRPRMGFKALLSLLSTSMLIWVFASHKSSLKTMHIVDALPAALHSVVLVSNNSSLVQSHGSRPDVARAACLAEDNSSAAQHNSTHTAKHPPSPAAAAAAASAAAGLQPPALEGAAGAANQAPLPKPMPGRYNATAAIPKIIHQNFMGGPQQLLRDALRPLSHFRKEWWQSCKTHHTGWQYKLWDAEACEQLLVQQYPWFLDTWRMLGRHEHSTVLKSDAIRPFILHAYGGVYLDLDSECFSDMSSWLDGAQLVLQAETDMDLNNAQMAGVPGHPLWAAMQHSIRSRVARGHKHPLKATGPAMVTDIFRHLTGNKNDKVAGGYVLPDGSRVAVYGRGQFFTPCVWDDWACAVKLARSKPLLRAKAKAVAEAAAKAAAAAAAAAAGGGNGGGVAAAAAGAAAPAVVGKPARAANSSADQAVSAAKAGAGAAAKAPQQQVAARQHLYSKPAAAATTQHAAGQTAAATAQQHAAGQSPAPRPAQLPTMLTVPGVVGVHHFSGSWLKLDGSKSLSLRQEGQHGVLDFLFKGTGFVQQPCSQLKLLAAHPHPQVAGVAAAVADTRNSSSSSSSGSSGSSSTADVGDNKSPSSLAGVAAASAAVPVCWEAITAAAQNQSCHVLSVRSLQPQQLATTGLCSCRHPSSRVAAAAAAAATGDGPTQQQQQQQQQQPPLLRLLAAELQLAAAGCSVMLVTNLPLDLKLLAAQPPAQQRQHQGQLPAPTVGATSNSILHDSTSSSGSSSLPSAAVLQRFTTVTAMLGISPDPFATPPVHTLDSLVDTELSGVPRLTLLLLDLTAPQPGSSCTCPGNNSSGSSGSSGSVTGTPVTVVDVLNQQYVSASTVLGRFDSLALSLRAAAAAAAAEAHKVYDMYQHLAQESGFVGYYHSASTASVAAGASATAASVAAAGKDASAHGVGAAAEAAAGSGTLPLGAHHLPVMLGMTRLPGAW